MMISAGSVYSASAGDVVINEVAWMGTDATYSDEWIELYNTTGVSIDLSNWALYKDGGTTKLFDLSGSISSGSYYLIEKTDDEATSITADLAISYDDLNDDGEYLVLKDIITDIDAINCQDAWYGGDNGTNKYSMERILPTESGNNSENWATNDGIIYNGKDKEGDDIYGTTGHHNSGYGTKIYRTSDILEIKKYF